MIFEKGDIVYINSDNFGCCACEVPIANFCMFIDVCATCYDGRTKTEFAIIERQEGSNVKKDCIAIDDLVHYKPCHHLEELYGRIKYEINT